MRLAHAVRNAAFAVSGLLAIGSAQAADEAILRINFTPWAMHAQYYAGMAKGFYAAQGIDLTIRPPSAGQQNEVFIGTGREQFGVANVDAFIQARANGVPVIAIMADEPDTPFSVITLKQANITEPAQLKGKKLSWFQNNVKGMVDPLLKEGGLTRDDINFVNVARGSEVQMLAAHQVDALFGFSFGQALTLDMKGFPTNVMSLRDHGVQFYGTVIYTSDKLLKDNPGLVKRFLTATLQSLIWTRDHQAEAVGYVVKVSPDRDQELETKKLGIIYKLYRSPDYAQHFGQMTDAKWQSSIDIMSKGNSDMPTPPDAHTMYSNSILDSIEESKTLAALVDKAS